MELFGWPVLIEMVILLSKGRYASAIGITGEEYVAGFQALVIIKWFFHRKYTRLRDSSVDKFGEWQAYF